jgi:MraZ protein
MFLGEYQHTLDAKGRVSLPARFREDLSGRLYVVKGFEKCLFVYQAAAYEEFLEKLLASNEFNPEARRVQRFFTAGAVESKTDGAGRVMLPPVLREYAGLDRDAVIIGNGDHVEIWSAAAWAEYDARTNETIEDAAEGLAAKGIL